MTREEAKAEIRELVVEQKGVWDANFRKYMAAGACEAGLCGKIDALVYAANTCKDAKRRVEVEVEIKHLRDCRREGWNLVHRELVHAEIVIRRLMKRHRISAAEAGIPMEDEEK